jgi:hypothetical protein
MEQKEKVQYTVCITLLQKVNKKYILYHAQCYESTRQLEMENLGKIQQQL